MILGLFVLRCFAYNSLEYSSAAVICLIWSRLSSHLLWDEMPVKPLLLVGTTEIHLHLLLRGSNKQTQSALWCYATAGRMCVCVFLLKRCVGCVSGEVFIHASMCVSMCVTCWKAMQDKGLSTGEKGTPMTPFTGLESWNIPSACMCLCWMQLCTRRPAVNKKLLINPGPQSERGGVWREMHPHLKRQDYFCLLCDVVFGLPPGTFKPQMRARKSKH